MLKNQAKQSCALIAACTIAAFTSTGCRSMPGSSLLGFRSQPSAEALAGAGPTTTYPVPPSASATPKAIDSIAGGTASPKSPSTSPAPPSGTAQVAGLDISPGYATQASNVSTEMPTSRAAAEANGVFAKSGYKSPKSPSGYTFGSKDTPPKPGSSSSSSYALGGSSYTPPGSSFTAPKSGFTPPPGSSFATTPPAEKEKEPSGGFTMPASSPAVAAISPPPVPSTTAIQLPDPPTEIMPPAATKADFSTASAADVSAPSVSPAKSMGGVSPGKTYMPGSTGTASGYPMGDEDPTTTGSFYR